MKALFYMIGAFPVVDKDGNIIPGFYSDIKNNLDNGVTLDWSKKILSDASVMPNKITYTNSGFAQRNRYLMKSDKEDAGESNSDKLIYYDGIGSLNVENETIERVKTIIQLPFNAPLKLDKENPTYDMGETFKCWDFDKDADRGKKRKWVKPNPIFGLIRDRAYYKSIDNGPYVEQGTVMSMIAWNEFKNILSIESYAYMQEIIRKPTIITEYIRLNEFDLRDLDYAVPVYLDKYNSYFAIVSIQRDSKGKCKCELIKLP